MFTPCNYGYVPQTLSGDGDPVDVLVLSPVPIITGVVVRSRPIGMLKMEDEAGDDTKVLPCRSTAVESSIANVDSPRDLPEARWRTISPFFAHYTDLEAGQMG
jgi:inorganic pyrophosphatase